MASCRARTVAQLEECLPRVHGRRTVLIPAQHQVNGHPNCTAVAPTLRTGMQKTQEFKGILSYLTRPAWDHRIPFLEHRVSIYLQTNQSTPLAKTKLPELWNNKFLLSHAG